MNNATMEFEEISQVAVVVKDLEKTIERYWKILGIGPWKIYNFAPPRLKEMTVHAKPIPYSMMVAETYVGRVILEIIEPIDGPSIYKEFLEEKGEGLHHIACYRVPDVKKTLDAFKEVGIGILQSGKFDDDEFYYMDTEKIFGVILEIVKEGTIPPTPDATTHRSTFGPNNLFSIFHCICEQG